MIQVSLENKCNQKNLFIDNKKRLSGLFKHMIYADYSILERKHMHTHICTCRVLSY